jgi:hypothetical protein
MRGSNPALGITLQCIVNVTLSLPLITNTALARSNLTHHAILEPSAVVEK